MLKSAPLSAWLLLGLLILGGGVAFGQSYPVKPIRIIAPEPGGSGDTRARLLAQGISGALGQPVIVENRPSSLIGEVLAKAAPDGYTLGSGGGPLWLGPLMQPTSYDPVRDFSPVIWSTATPHLLLVHPSLPVRSVKELIALAKTKPGELNYSSGPIGSEAQLGGDLLKSMSGINTVRIPYKGGVAAMNALISGEVHWMIYTLLVSMSQVKSGKLRALAITSTQPSELLPAVPTVASAGLPGYEVLTISGVLAPSGTPTAIIERLNQEMVRVFKRADVKENYSNDGAEIVGGSPAQFAAKIKSEIAKWGKIIKDAEIKIN